MRKLERLVTSGFGVDIDTFTEAVRVNPSAQGYIDGAISEFLLRKLLDSSGYELERIMEKWKGEKPLRHHGDFYIRINGSKNWYVLESKGLKSNSEEWHKLNIETNLVNFLRKWDKSSMVFASDNESKQWCRENFRGNISDIRIRTLETHFVAGRGGKTQREIATSRNDEFDYIAVDLFLRTGKHEFIFARPEALPPSKNHPKHLQQNYIIDVLLASKKEEINIQPPWYRDLDEIFDETKTPIKEEDKQVNKRGRGPGLATGPWLLFEDATP